MLVRFLARRTTLAALALASFGSPVLASDDTSAVQLATPAINALGLRRWAAVLLGHEDDDRRWVRIGPGETSRHDPARAASSAAGRPGRGASSPDAAPPPDSAARARRGVAPAEFGGAQVAATADSASPDSTGQRRLAPRTAEPLESRGEPDAHHAPLSLAARVVSPAGTWPVVAEIALPSDERATIEVFDVAGRRLVRERLVPMPAGPRLMALDFTPRASGVYWLRLEQGGRAVVANLVVRR